MYEVLDSYQRFDQKNNMMMRPIWDSSMEHIIPTTMETKLRHMEQKERSPAGFGRRDFALAASSGLIGSSLGTDINQPNRGLTSWDKIPVNQYLKLPECDPVATDPEIMTNQVQHVARHLGADLVGIANLDKRWFYSNHYISETRESRPVEIDDRYQHIIAMAIEMDYDMVGTAPSAQHQAEVSLTYSKLAFLAGAVAHFIRSLGYRAIPAINDTALNVPIAVDAGLGELSRIGVLITPQYGPRQRLCKVITDLPLQANHPIEFGVTQFCTVCKKCATKCPSQAIFPGERTAKVSGISNNPGVLKWPLAAEKCREYFSKMGTNCGICLRVCPYNKRKTIFHQTNRWIIEHTPWMMPVYVWLDDFFGYGKQNDPNLFWRSDI